MVASQTLIRTKKVSESILSAAFKGRLVAQDPEEESADVLLQKILAVKARRHDETGKNFKSRARLNAQSMRRRV